MLTRDDVAQFLKGQADKKVSVEEVLSNFSSYAVTKGLPVEKVGKSMMDLKSYAEWIWG